MKLEELKVDGGLVLKIRRGDGVERGVVSYFVKGRDLVLVAASNRPLWQQNQEHLMEKRMDEEVRGFARWAFGAMEDYPGQVHYNLSRGMLEEAVERWIKERKGEQK